MPYAAIAYASQLRRVRAMMVTSSIGPGTTNMVKAAALAHVNRQPVLLVPGEVFANRSPDPILRKIEDFGDGTVSAYDCFKPVSRFFDRPAASMGATAIKVDSIAEPEVALPKRGVPEVSKRPHVNEARKDYDRYKQTQRAD